MSNAPTNSGGGYVARRSAGESPRTGCSGFFSLAAPSLRQTSSLGSRRAASSFPLQPPLPGLQALRRATPPVLREGLEAPGALESEAAAASAEALAAASEAGAVAGVGAGAEAAELAEAKPRTRSGSPSPSWAAWSKT